MELRKKKLLRRRFIIIITAIVSCLIIIFSVFYIFSYKAVQQYVELRFHYSHYDDMEENFNKRAQLFTDDLIEKMNQENNLTETQGTVNEMRITSTLNEFKVAGVHFGINKCTITVDIKYTLYSELLNETVPYDCKLQFGVKIESNLKSKIYSIDLIHNSTGSDEGHEH